MGEEALSLREKNYKFCSSCSKIMFMIPRFYVHMENELCSLNA